MRPACGRRAIVGFYPSHGLVRVCEIMGKNNGNPDLVCEKEWSLKKIKFLAILVSIIGMLL